MPDTCCEKFGCLSHLLLLGLCGAGIALQVLAGLECNFITYKNADDFGSNNNNGTVETGSVGMIYQRPYGTEECVKYAYTSGGNYVTTARTAMIVALSGAAVATSLVLFEVLIVRVCCARVFQGMGFNLAVIATGIVFIIFASPACNSPFGCSWGIGAIYNVVAGSCYFLAWALTCFTPKPKPLLRKMCCPEKSDVESQKKNGGVAESLDDLGTVDPNNNNEYEPYDPDKPYDPSTYTTTSPDNNAPHYASPY